MNALEALVFLSDLRRRAGPFLLMPDGLREAAGEGRVGASRRPAAALLGRWFVGDVLVLSRRPRLPDILAGGFPEMFLRDEGWRPRPVGPPAPPVPLDLTWEEALRRVEGLTAVEGKGPYERFLEAMVVMAFMESLKNSKVTLGGVWTSESSDPTARRGRGYEVFVRNVGERNRTIERLKVLAAGLPEVQIEEAALFRLAGPRPWVSEYARYLERFWAIVELRNALQRLHLMLPYASEEERNGYRLRVEEARRVLRLYLGEGEEKGKGV